MKGEQFHDWREWRRFRAVQLARLGWLHRDIAEAMGISEQAVSQWLAQFALGGRAALLSHPHGGHAKLTAPQKALIPDFLWHGAEAYGFQGEFWTCARIAKVLQEELGVAYHKDHVSRMLRGLGWLPRFRLRGRSSATKQRWNAGGRSAGRTCWHKPAGSAAHWFLQMNRGSTCCPPWSGLTSRRG